MKKITFLLLFLMACASGAFAQCINTVPYPFDPVPAESFGEVQEIGTCAYTKEFSTISGMLIGADYIFTCVDGTLTDKYITVTDLANTVIAHGPSPLTVEGVTASSVRLHYSEDNTCAIQEICHVTTLQAVLTCPVPVNIEISGITTTNATFTWEAGDVETEWQVVVIGAGDAEPGVGTTGTTVLTTPEFSVSNLSAGNPYRFYIRAKCGTEFSPWRGPVSFASACLPTALFNQDFESAAVGELPICWTPLYIDTGEEAYIRTVDNVVHLGERALEIANGDTPETANLLLVSPPLSTLTTGTHRLKFFARGYGNVNLEVGTVSSMDNTAVFNMVETISATEDYAEFVVDFTDYTGTDTFIAFRHPSTSTYNPVFLDDIRWELAPLCPDVEDITLDAVTPATATISWTAGGSEAAWNVVYGLTTVEDPTTLTPLSPASATASATIPGLLPGTDYKAWVRSSCGGTAGDGAWIGPVTFTTACLAVALFTENFNTTDQNDLPECWSSIVSENASNDAYVYVTEGDGVAGSNAAMLYNADSVEDADIILVSPNINTLAAGTHRLKFSARSQGTGSIEIGTLSNPVGGPFAAFDTIELTNTYQEYVVDFTTNPVTDTYIGIRNTSDTYTGVLIDNIRWELAPLCPDVTQLTADVVTPASITLSWTPNAETQWDVVYGAETVTDPATLTPISPAPTVAPTATLAGLTDNTTYNIWVRAVCGGTQGTGAWIGPLEVKTACLPTGTFNEGFETTEYGDIPDCWSALIYGATVSEYAAVRTVDFMAATGENSIEVWNDESGPDDFVMLVSPYLNTLSTATHRLKFSASAYDPATLDVGTLSGPTSDAVFTSYEVVEVEDEPGNYTVDFTAYTGTDTYVALRNVSGTYTSIFIDDIKWEVSPLCPDVLGITVSNVTVNSALVEWTPGTETNWQVVYGPATVTDPETLTPSSILTNAEFTLAGLNNASAYNVWVRSVCGSNGNGAWMGPIALNTLCLPTTVPYTEDFETSIVPALPACGVIQNAGDGNDWITEENPGYGFTSNTLVYEYNSDYDADAWYFTRGLQLTGGVEYTISYRYGNNSEDNYVESLKVMYGTSPDNQSMIEDIADHPAIDTGAPSVSEVTFTPVATGVYYFGFQAYSIANQYDLYVDDIVVTATLGTGNVTRGTFTYHPNPVKNNLTISYSDSINNVTVYNLLGQMVLENSVNNTTATVDMSALPAGNYIVKVAADGVAKTIKVIKE